MTEHDSQEHLLGRPERCFYACQHDRILCPIASVPHSSRACRTRPRLTSSTASNKMAGAGLNGNGMNGGAVKEMAMDSPNGFDPTANKTVTIGEAYRLSGPRSGLRATLICREVKTRTCAGVARVARATGDKVSCCSNVSPCWTAHEVCDLVSRDWGSTSSRRASC